jgi:transposase-like protein
MITDKLASYGAAKRIMPSIEHRQHKGLNNRAENSRLLLTTELPRNRYSRSGQKSAVLVL